MSGRPHGAPAPAAASSVAYPEGRLGHSRVGVLAVIEEEFASVCRVFGTTRGLPDSGYVYDYEISPRIYNVVAGDCPYRTNTGSFAAVRDFIEFFRPTLLVLVGIAGGIERREGVDLGDVVVAEYVQYMEFLKIAKTGVELRYVPLDQPAGPILQHHAKVIARDDRWQEGMLKPRPDGTRKSKVHFGAIVAGEKILSNETDIVQKKLLEPFAKALAVDMESKGVGEAMCLMRTSVWYNPRYIVVRGVSDIIERVRNTKATTSFFERLVGSETPAAAPSRTKRSAWQHIRDGFDWRQHKSATHGSASQHRSERSNEQQRELWKEYAAESAACFAKAVVERWHLNAYRDMHA